MEYPIPQIEHEGDRLFLLASSPFDKEPFLLQLKTITSQFVRVTTFRILNERSGDKMRFLGMADVPYDSKNDVFGTYCAPAIKNGIVKGEGETTELFPNELLKAFRGEYGIGKQP